MDYTPVLRTKFAPDGDSIAAAAQAALRGEAPRPLCRPGHSLVERLCRAQGAGRAARHSRLHQPARQEQLRRDASARRSALGGAAMPYAVRHFLEESDLILGAGCSFTATAFGIRMPTGKTVIHATLDPVEINRAVETDIALIGDAKLTLRALIEACKAIVGRTPRDSSAVAAEIAKVAMPTGSRNGCPS